ncbi:MAG TPA: hypothetical protein VK709_00010 [Candidatus Saccharimonadales bacterium]|nr:hypothetical protein [Candidatus Saccharimonadales bacterium]
MPNMAEADTVAVVEAVFTVEAVEVSTVVVAVECARVAAVVPVAGHFLLLLLGLVAGEVSLLLVSDSVMVLPVVQEIIFRGPAAILQTGMGV